MSFVQFQLDPTVRAPPPTTSEGILSTRTTRVSKPLVQTTIPSMFPKQRLRPSQVQSKLVNKQSRLGRTIRAPPPKTSEGSLSTRTTRVSKPLVQKKVDIMFAKQRLRQSQAQPKLVNGQTADISRQASPSNNVGDVGSLNGTFNPPWSISEKSSRPLDLSPMDDASV